MKKNLILLFVMLCFTQMANGQNFFFIGENSFPSTERFTLQSNSDISDLDVLFAKDESKGLIIVSSKLSSSVRVSGRLIIYLDNGTVISSEEELINDNVDEIASSVYGLTNEDLSKLKNSNINTIRYQIECPECFTNHVYEGNHSASNNGNSRTDFTAVITEFFSK